MLPSNTRAATQPLACSPSVINFGQVGVGQSTTQPVVVTNRGETTATISAIMVSDSEFQVTGIKLPVVLSPGESASLSVKFAPTEMGSTTGNVSFTSDLSDSNLHLSLEGYGVKAQALTSSPSSLSFGNILMGTDVSHVVVVSCKSCPEKVSGVLVEGNAFFVTGLNLPVTITPTQSMTLQITFNPETAGATSGSVFLLGPGLNIPVTGTGTTTSVGQLSISPATLTFGNVNVGSSGAQSATVSASGGNVTVSSASSNNSQFAISGASFPLTLALGQSTEFKVVFSPTQSGAATAEVTVTSNASDATATVSATGSGVEPKYSVSLSWNASSSSVVGYNVYRGTAKGSYAKVNPSLDRNTTYTDTTVSSGTYYYAATAVNSSGQESGYSSPIEVVIP